LPVEFHRLQALFGRARVPVGAVIRRIRSSRNGESRFIEFEVEHRYCVGLIIKRFSPQGRDLTPHCWRQITVSSPKPAAMKNLLLAAANSRQQMLLANWS